MTRIELGTGIGAENFNPTDFSYTRETEEGAIPIINYLIGSHFNENIDGLFTFSNTNGLETPVINNSGGKLQILGDADVNENNETAEATHSTFTYLWPKTLINSNLELEDEQTGEINPGIVYDQIARTFFEDISSGDQLIIELHSGNSVADTRAYLVILEKVNNVITELSRVDLPTGQKSIDWQLKFLDEGVSKFRYKTQFADAVTLWKGDFKADVAECKVVHQLETNFDTAKTIKFDFIWILYKSIFCGYDLPIENKSLGCVCIFDTNKTETETDWSRVYSKDHKFEGDRVIQNGLVRIRFKDTPEVEISGWQTFETPAWVVLGSLIPKNSMNNKASALVDVVIRKFNESIIILDVNFGIISHTYRLSKGMSYTRINTRSKFFDFVTTKERFALSSDDQDVTLLKWNQLHSDDDDRGNPLGTFQSGPTNPAVFTFDNDTDTGLGKIDDVWYAFYNPTNDDVVAWIGSFLKPNSLEVEATSITELKEARFGFDKNILIAIGQINSKPLTKTNGKPKMFFPGAEDEYVKWKANAAIFAFDQNPFIRKRR